MGTDKFPFIILCFTIFSKANGYVDIEAPNDKITIKDNGEHRYTIEMDENNHNFKDRVALFKIKNMEDCSQIIIQFTSDTSFQSKIEDCIGYSMQSFDYENERQRAFSFNIFKESTEPTEVKLNVRNIDDESPILTCPECEMDENTMYDIKNTPCKYTLEDPDGWLSKMKFTVISGVEEEDKIFELKLPENILDDVYKISVPLINIIELDYKKNTFYSFSVKVVDSGNNNATQTATVKVHDIRNTNPIWTNFINFKQFEEKSVQEIDVKAIDGDTGINSQICYKKVKEGDPEGHDENYITIGNDTGHIIVNKIDRDKYDQNTYDLSIEAFVCNESDWYTTLNISFYVDDIDDNPPLIISNKNLTDGSVQEFTKDEIKILPITFLENYNGKFNVSTFIKDIDTGENAEFSVNLVKKDNFDYTVAYIIVPTAGYKNGDFRISVFDNKYLDYEDEIWRNNFFYVKSTGTYNESKSDIMFVNVSLIDYNDEIPIFDDKEYFAEINETAKTGDFVVLAHATDRDAEDKILTMNIIGTYAENRLAIDSDGNITVDLRNEEYSFDYDVLQSVFFQVSATDAVNHTTTVPVTLTILDVNNKPPTIYPVNAIIVEEDQDDGTNLNVKIKATDPDTTAKLVPKIDWENTKASKNNINIDMSVKANREAVQFLKTKVTSDSGKEIIIELIVENSHNTKPNYLIFDSLYLNLVVTDLNTSKEFLNNKETSATILINIKDINNNPPYFPDSNNETMRKVSEDATMETSVGFIQALDPDTTDDPITYNCTADDQITRLQINNKDGAFTVNGIIDADHPPTYYFYYTCQAYDTLHYSTPYKVPFYIIDTNNKIPQIHMQSTVEIVEKSKAGEKLTDINTTDEDRDVPYHTVQCKLNNEGKYKSCSEEFEVVKEVGTDGEIIQVTNGNMSLDRDHGRTFFSCELTCVDNPDKDPTTKQNTVNQPFTINLLDLNDHTPELVGDQKLEAFENLTKGSEIGTIKTVDYDYKENGTIDLTIWNNNKDLKLKFSKEERTDENPEQIFHFLTDIDLRGMWGTYNVNITLSDEAKEDRRENNYLIPLTIKKVIFAPPVFIFPNITNIYLLSSQEVGSPLVQIRGGATLPDFEVEDGEDKNCAKWDVTFDYEPKKKYNFFKFHYIKSCVSQLQINNNYNKDTVPKEPIKLTITAWYSKDEIYSENAKSSIEITVTFIDNPDDPFFVNTDPWIIDFKEVYTSQTKKLENKAKYDPDDNNYPVFYLLKGSDLVNKYFEVNLTEGDISIKEPFYKDNATKYEFQILASKDHNLINTNHNSTLDVIINVQSVNYRPPSFRQKSYFGAIMPTFTTDFPVLQIEAIDLDEIDKGHLEISIEGEITKNGNGLEKIPDPAFSISDNKNDAATVKLQFYVDSTMTGYFQFNVLVKDQPIDFGPFNDTASVTIYIITKENTVNFNFLNKVTDVENNKEGMLEVVSNVLGKNTYIQNIVNSNTNNENVTIATLYFFEKDSSKLCEGEDILKILSDIKIFSNLVTELKEKYSLYLTNFPSTNGNDETDVKLKKWLLGMSIVLGILCFALIVALIWKTRQLKRTISKLTTKKFGSQESDINRVGLSAPTTNKHTLEGSNPVYKNDELKNHHNMADIDKQSIRSGDSDLIGVENNPEFDLNFNSMNNKATYL